MTTFFFAHPWALGMALAMPMAITGCYYWARRTRCRRLAMFLTTRQAAKAMDWSQERWRVLSATLVGLALMLLCGAVARPLSGPRPNETRAHGIDAYVLLDCSKSMLVSDVLPDRLEFAKRSLMKWREVRAGDRLGLVLIGGDAFVAIPPTLGAESFNLILGKVGYHFVPGGSNLARGIDAAVKDLIANQKDGKYPKPAIVLVSDGGPTAGDAVSAARTAWETHGIPVYCIGIGTTAGGRVPRTSGWYRTAVFSRLDAGLLQAVARAGGGTYLHAEEGGDADAAQATLERLYHSELARLATLSGRIEVEDYDEWFPLPLGLALLLLLAEPLVQRRRRVSAQEPERLPVSALAVAGNPTTATGQCSGPPVRNRLQHLASARLPLLGIMLAGAWAGTEPNIFASIDTAAIQRAFESADFDEAERLLRTAPVDGTDQPDVTYNLGIVAYAHARSLETEGTREAVSAAQKRYLEAIEHLQQVSAASDPALAERARFQLGNVKTRLGSLLARRDTNGLAGAADALEEAIRGYHALEGTAFAEDARRNRSQAEKAFAQTAVSFAQQKLASAEAKPANTPKRIGEQNTAFADAWALLQRLDHYEADNAEAVRLRREIGGRWAGNLVKLADPFQAEAQRLFALSPAGGKGRSPKWNEAIKAQSRAVELLGKAVEVWPDEPRIAAQFSLAKARLIGELTDLVRDNIATRGRAYDVLAGITMRTLETAERYAAPDDLQVVRLRGELLTAIEQAAVAEGDRLIGDFERQRANPGKEPPAHSRLSGMKEATLEARLATALSQAIGMYDKGLALNPLNEHATYQKTTYEPLLAEAFAAMGRSELQAAKALVVATGSAAREAGVAHQAGARVDVLLSDAGLQQAMAHLENARNGISQAQGLGFSDPGLSALQHETEVLIAQLRTQQEAHGSVADDAQALRAKDGDGAASSAKNAGGMPVESYVRHFARGRKAQANDTTAGGGTVEKDW